MSCGVVGDDVVGAADTWPPFFREDGYRGLMQQLQKHGVTYKEVHGIAQASRDAERFKGYLAVPLSDGEALDFHGDISTLWRLCKDTFPGKHPPPHVWMRPLCTAIAAHRMRHAAAARRVLPLTRCVPTWAACIQPVPTMAMPERRPRPAVSAA